jgi:FG-GAP repeat
LNTWGEVKKIVARDRAAYSSFGFSVAISGNTLVVGSNGDDIGTISDQGSAYIFRRNAGGENNWGQTKKLLGSDLANERWASFGYSVGISGTTVFIGTGKRAVYIFERDQGGVNNWGEVKKLVPSDLGYGFGKLAISDNILVVGAFYANGINQNQGAAYIFEQNQGGLNNWGEVKKLVASDGATGDQFGYSVATNGNIVVIGAPSNSRGSVYRFRRDTGGTNNWGAIARLSVSDSTSRGFGSALAFSGNTVVVGAPTSPRHEQLQSSAYIFE